MPRERASKAPTLDVTRSQAAGVIEAIRRLIAIGLPVNPLTLKAALEREGLWETALTPCPGEAHTAQVAGNIDHCQICAPRWGWCGPSVRVK